MSELDKIPKWVVFVGSYPYCREHGALLCVNKECNIWRCSVCHKGVEYQK